MQVYKGLIFFINKECTSIDYSKQMHISVHVYKSSNNFYMIEKCFLISRYNIFQFEYTNLC